MKLFYLTTEITPFAGTYSLADFSAKVPLQLQNKEHDIRTIIPKYGFVSERKYILREVIRLREIPFTFGNEEQVASAKSAFIPKTRVQVYFLEHAQWFKPLTNLLYKSKNGRPYSDNDLRCAFFGKAALATLPHLFWKPDIILCNDWQGAFVPLLYTQHFAQDPFYKGMQTVLIIHSLSEYVQFSREAYETAGLTLPDFISGDTVNGFEVAAQFADRIIVLESKETPILADLMKHKGIKSVDSKISVIEVDSDAESFTATADQIDQIIQEPS